tara:strand:- start:2241 stop:2480 length:240 start_codon:yes stop_codon:yes gene_type:complete
MNRYTASMNNVYVYHKGREISISHHRDKDPLPDEREVAVIPDKDRGETYSNMYLERYGSSLNSLINELIKVRDEIDKQN